MRPCSAEQPSGFGLPVGSGVRYQRREPEKSLLHGVFAPHSKHRARIIPHRPQATPPSATTSPQRPSRSRSVLDWASLLSRVFALDVLPCERCGGRRRLLTMVAEAKIAHPHCLRFAARVAPSPRKTRFRLLGQLRRAGFHSRSVPSQGFTSFILLAQASLGANAVLLGGVANVRRCISDRFYALISAR